MSLTKAQAEVSFKKVNAELSKLEPSTIIYLYEIDLTDILFDLNISDSDTKVFRFHNNVKLTTTDIYWRGNRYIAAPIKSDGFEVQSRGTLPTPKLAITTSSKGIQIFKTFKTRLDQLGDLVGAKVTRRKTFLKFLDKKNFEGTSFPDGFDEDESYDPVTNPNGGQTELLPDVFFIERKSLENNNSIEFELSSILDLENIQLPFRQVIAERCTADYRGIGCYYEYEDRRNTEVHGTASLLSSAPPVADENDELISEKISPFTIKEPEEYNPQKTYVIGDSVFITKNGRNFYFVAKQNNLNPPVSPPNLNYWIPDSCSKLIKGCRLRYQNKKRGSLPIGALPFNGYPAVKKLNQ